MKKHYAYLLAMNAKYFSRLLERAEGRKECNKEHYKMCII
jgi:hypothetical protein